MTPIPLPTSRRFPPCSGQAPKFRQHELCDCVRTTAPVASQITLRRLAVELRLRSTISGAAHHAEHLEPLLAPPTEPHTDGVGVAQSLQATETWKASVQCLPDQATNKRPDARSENVQPVFKLARRCCPVSPISRRLVFLLMQPPKKSPFRVCHLLVFVLATEEDPVALMSNHRIQVARRIGGL